jgi:O-antigen/teichoic acid export membrane protein
VASAHGKSDIRHHVVEIARPTLNLFGNSAANLGLGFIATLVAAHYYPEAAVGVAATLISQVGLIGGVAKGGVDTAILRHFRGRPSKRAVLRALVVPWLLALLVAAMFAAWDAWEGGELAQNGPWLVALGLALGVSAYLENLLLDAALTAAGRTASVLVRNVCVGTLRLILLVTLPSILPDTGVYVSYVLAFSVGTLVGFLLLARSWDTRGAADVPDGFWAYSLRNAPANLAALGPLMVLPLVVYAEFGAEPSARFYVAFMVGYLGIIFPNVVGAALLAGHGEEAPMRKRYRIAIILALVVASAFALFAYVAGSYVLGLLGHNYIEGRPVLVAVAVAAIPQSVAVVSLNFLRRRGHRGTLTVGAIPNAMLLVLFALLAPSYGVSVLLPLWTATGAVAAVVALWHVWADERDRSERPTMEARD